MDAVALATRIVRERSAGMDAAVDWVERGPLRIVVTPRARGGSLLVRGGVDDPLFEQLRTALPAVRQLDVVVAFAMVGGVQLMADHFAELLARGRRLRLLTGDYRCVTEPDALQRLLDLDGDVELRVFETKGGQSFHPKAWILRNEDGSGLAFVGSSNLSETALETGIEWNYRVIDARDADGFAAVCEGFERLFVDRRTRPLTWEWIDDYRRRFANRVAEVREVADETVEPPKPNEVQIDALAKLAAWRAEGNRAGLVVLATGLGKTWLAAFDSRAFGRVLFVAHREEILAQARATFRRIRPNARLGLFTGSEKDGDAEVLFASIQTLGRANHLRGFARDHFDYIVVDEFHHAAAATYRRLIEHFTPRFLLGLTATPERSDGADLLALCGYSVVHRVGLAAGIRRGLLCGIEYHGVADDLDFAQIPWRSGRFDPDALDAALATQRRAALALDHHARFGGARTLAFCASQRHADHLAEYFRGCGKRAVAVHAGASSAPRANALEDLRDGRLDVVFCVDMFNEGVDVPAIDTVLMLRPTESRIVWLQQLGRGLRKAEGKSHLRVIDSIGNHRCFLDKPRELLAALCGVDGRRESLRDALYALRNHTLELPPGCSIDYELDAIDILSKLLEPARAEDFLRDAYVDFRARHDRRPTAADLCGNRSLDRPDVRRFAGSWFAFVARMSDLSATESVVARVHAPWFAELESTPTEKSYQMLVYLALLELDALPGEASLDEIEKRVLTIASRDERLCCELSAAAQKRGLRAVLMQSPIPAITGMKVRDGERGPGSPFFEPTTDPIRTKIQVADGHRQTFVAMSRELVEWRLAEYLAARRA
ncbi:MAG: DEAD/DEAH box helicase family protein [Planctomycetes bacterium]|nr:DEAD/DEAH box helicase family protein [Planctomycetota bacterium]